MGIQQVRNELRRRQHVLNADVLADFKKGSITCESWYGWEKRLEKKQGRLAAPTIQGAPSQAWWHIAFGAGNQ